MAKTRVLKIYKKARTIPERLATPRRYFPTSTAPIAPEAGFAVVVGMDVFAAFDVEEATTEVAAALVDEEERTTDVALAALVDEERTVVLLADLMLELVDKMVLLGVVATEGLTVGLED